MRPRRERSWYPRMTMEVVGETGGMSLVEHGAYALMLDWYYNSKRAVANGDINRQPRFEWKRAFLACSAWSQEEKAAVRFVVDKFFLIDGDGWRPRTDWDDLLEQSERRPAIPTDVRRAVLARDGDRCVYCGGIDGPFHLDHRLPWSRGGRHTVENLAVSCRDCNLAKSALTDDEFAGARS